MLSILLVLINTFMEPVYIILSLKYYIARYNVTDKDKHPLARYFFMFYAFTLKHSNRTVTK